MKTAILASGPSLTDENIDYIKQAREDGRIDTVIAVSDVGLLKAPWADLLISHDCKWWSAHPEAAEFKGLKLSRHGSFNTIKYDPDIEAKKTGLNSGLFAMCFASHVLKSEEIVLLGFDLHNRKGAHFFGEHTAMFNGRHLPNSNEADFKRHIEQFNHFKGCKVINCNPDSDLKCFEFADLRDII